MIFSLGSRNHMDYLNAIFPLCPAVHLEHEERGRFFYDLQHILDGRTVARGQRYGRIIGYTQVIEHILQMNALEFLCGIALESAAQIV